MFAIQFTRVFTIFAIAFLPACGKSSKSASNKKPKTPPQSAYALEQVISFGRDGNSERYKQGGWGETEDDRTWTNGYSARLRFTTQEANEPLRLRMKLAGMTHPPALPYQPVQVFVNDERIADWQVSEPADFFAVIPADLANRARLMVELRMPQANSPKALGIGEEARTLGICCFELVINKTTAAVVREEREKRSEDPLAGFDNGYSLGTVVYLGAGAGGQRYKGSGWHTAEKGFAWTGGGPAVLELTIPPTTRPLKLRMRAEGMIDPAILPAQPTQVFVNGIKVADWSVGELADYAAIIPLDPEEETGRLRIELRCPAAASPQEWERGEDTRPLGLRCEAFIIEEASADEVNESAESRPTPRPSPRGSR